MLPRVNLTWFKSLIPRNAIASTKSVAVSAAHTSLADVYAYVMLWVTWAVGAVLSCCRRAPRVASTYAEPVRHQVVEGTALATGLALAAKDAVARKTAGGTDVALRSLRTASDVLVKAKDTVATTTVEGAALATGSLLAARDAATELVHTASTGTTKVATTAGKATATAADGAVLACATVYVAAERVVNWALHSKKVPEAATPKSPTAMPEAPLTPRAVSPRVGTAHGSGGSTSPIPFTSSSPATAGEGILPPATSESTKGEGVSDNLLGQLAAIHSCASSASSNQEVRLNSGRSIPVELIQTESMLSVSHPPVMRVVLRNQSSLTAVFDAFSVDQRMSWAECMNFTTAYHIVPALCNFAQLRDVWSLVNRSEAADDDVDAFDTEEFLEFLVRLSVLYGPGHESDLSTSGAIADCFDKFLSYLNQFSTDASMKFVRKKTNRRRR